MRKLGLSMVMCLMSYGTSLSADLGCDSGSVFVDEVWGCVKASEVQKAKEICEVIKSDFRECLCEDGGIVGACGD